MNWHNLSLQLLFYSFNAGYFLVFAEESWIHANHDMQHMHCAKNDLIELSGVISSPEYPEPLSDVFCSVWNILVPPYTYLKIHLIDLDIAKDCIEPECCQHNWLTLPGISKGDPDRKYCGNDVSSSRPIIVSTYQSPSTIKFYYSNPIPNSRGLKLDYVIVDIDKYKCGDDQFQCSNGTCLPLTMRCDTIKQCVGGEDESHCHTKSLCPQGEIQCSLRANYCYKPEERCDSRFQCLFGEDEAGCVPGCEQLIMCSSGEGCYHPNQRCDSRSDCMDESDESGCPPELCVSLPDKRQCRNGRCIQARLWCDGSDDCGDSSDEESCLQNSVITAAMMGALLGGLFLVLAVGCTLRYYARRPTVVQPSVASRLRMSHSLSLPAHIDDEFFHREPPPAYSVAVADVCLLSSAPRHGRGRTRGCPLLSVRRQQGSSQGRAAQPKPPGSTESNSAGSTDSNNSHSPENLMSSTPPSSFCNDDTIQLISA